MDMQQIEQLVAQWRDYKSIEESAVENRRQVEDQIVSLMELDPSKEGTINLDVGDFKVKLVNRLNRKVNSEMLQEIAAEHGLTEHLSALFRWKPEINMTVWKSTEQSITTPLLDAITTTPGRPSFSVNKEEI